MRERRPRRRTAAGGVQAEKQQRYVRLIAQGISNSEACRLVGINRKTGTRWRYGRTVVNSAGEALHYAAVKISEPKRRSPRYLSQPERIVIADLLARGESIRAIARELGRSPSTISREIRRNGDSDGRYRPHRAEHAARARMCRPRLRRIAVDTVLAGVVAGLLGQRWSPEQVAHELRVLFAGHRRRWLCVESIYQAIYDPAVEITRPARRRRRRRRLAGLLRRGRLTAMTMIDQRPIEVEDRVQVGHWEGDLIMGPSNRTAIGTLIERRTRFVVLLAFPGAVPTADAVRHAISTAFGNLPSGLSRTLTWDQGKELALHQQITASTGTRVFFCDAHAPWQRGSNENMNGLLRDYFAKGTDLSAHTVEELQRVALEINHRPRKTLAWSRPRRPLPACARRRLKQPPTRTAGRDDRAGPFGPNGRSRCSRPRSSRTALSAITGPASPLRGSGHPRMRYSNSKTRGRQRTPRRLRSSRPVATLAGIPMLEVGTVRVRCR
jgi:IS30 family transposase